MRISTLLPITNVFTKAQILVKSIFFSVIILLLGKSTTAQTRTLTFSDPGSFSWTAPCGISQVNVQIWGAGGGGGGAVTVFFTGAASGGGGGGGAFRNQGSIPVTAGTTYTIVVGAGGTSENNGGNSSAFGFSANGGLAGVGGIANNGAGGNGATGASYNGGSGASGTSSIGGGGGSSAGTTANGTNAVGSIGATAPLGGANGGNGASGDGANGNTPGGGGGGARVANSLFNFAAGGAGGDGLVIITYTGPYTYCVPSFTTVSAITSVNFAGITNADGGGTAQWQQYCNQATVIVGNTYPITVGGNASGGGNTDYYSVYIDWNQNGDLGDDGQYNIGTRTSTGTVTNNITVPLTATTGTTRMRIIKRRTGYATGPCQTSTNGQAEDYIVLIQPVPNCTTPANPTALNLTFQSTPVYAINGSFTGSGATGYIVIQTTGPTVPLAPTNGVTYAIGSNVLGGTVIANGATTTFVATNVFQNQQYCFWVYAYNGNCVGAPFYSNGNATACLTTASCNQFATMTLTDNQTKDWSVASNWSPAIVPTACTHVTINYTAENGNTIRNAVALINANFNIKSLTIVGNFNPVVAYSATRQKSMTLQNNGFILNIQDSLKIISDGGIDQLATGNSAASHKITFNSIGNSKLNVYGNTYIGGTDDEQQTIFGSDGGTPTFYFWGNVTYNKYANAAPNGNYVFEKNGSQAQSLINNISTANTSLRLLYQNLNVGEAGTSYPLLTLSGTGALKTGINGGNLAIKTGASLNLPNGTGLSQHTAASSGTFSMDGTAQMYVGGTSSNVTHSGSTYPGYAGTNFPANFGSYALANTSTVNYNSNGGVHQTIFPTAVYGNLVLSVGNGSATITNKTLNANISGITGDLTVLPYATFNMQTNTANRTTAGGTFTLAANANLSVGGNAGGAGPNNNFPGNFNSKVFAINSNTYYNFGSAQGIHGAVDYGNLYLSVAGGKTAPATLNINGNLAITGTAFFIHNSGAVYFNGASNAQTYTALTPAIFYNLYNNNTNALGLSVQNNLSIENEISMSANSKLFLTGDIILLSNSSSTASVTAMPTTAMVDYAGGGRFEVQRYIQHYQKWNLLGVPLRTTTSLRTTWQENGATGPSATGIGTQITGPGGGNGLDASSAGYSIKWWNATSQAFVNVNNTNTEMANRPEGFYVYVRGDRNYGPGAAGSFTTLRARGEIYTGANLPPLFTRSGLAANATISFANPYASAIDFAKVYPKASNIKAGFHVWDPSLTGNYSQGSYQYITSTGVITPGTGLYTVANVGAGYTKIQSGQVVYIEPNTAGTIALSLAETDKVGGSRLLTRGQGDLDDPIMMSTMLHNSDGQLIDGNRVMYNTDFTNQLGVEDATKILNAGENFGIISSARRLIVEGRKPIVANDTIFYNMSNLRNQNYKLSFEPKYLSGNGLVAELKDSYLNSTTSISLTDSTYYNFTANADAASKAPGRFMLVFKPATVLPVNFVKITAEANADRSNAIQWVVANEINIAGYMVERSSDGRNFDGILNADAIGVDIYNKTDRSPLITTDNFYRIKAIGIGGELTYSPIVRVTSTKKQPAIAVVNPVVGRQLNLQFMQQLNGNYSIELIANTGQLIQNSRVSIASPMVSQTILLNPSIATGSYKLVIKSEVGGQIIYSSSLLVE